MTIEELLIKEEGFCPHAYKDTEGYWTIGFGKLIDERKGGGITRAEGMMLLVNEIDTKKQRLDSSIPWWRRQSETRQTILLAMAFQIGVEGLLKFTKTLAAVKAGNYELAAKGMRASLWARQTPGRAERMAKAMESGVFS